MRLLKHRLRFLPVLLLGLSAAIVAGPSTGGHALAQDQQQAQPTQQPEKQPAGQPPQSPQLANGLLDAAVADLNKAKKDFAAIEDDAKEGGLMTMRWWRFRAGRMNSVAP